ncbi:hypothetical protein P40081_24175 [Paenibacillus sp. FSL P4-0081]|nr:hypothetical protein P40081_24175 [Paenibacillus sp. FSL P4-0081]
MDEEVSRLNGIASFFCRPLYHNCLLPVFSSRSVRKSGFISIINILSVSILRRGGGNEYQNISDQ